MSDIFISYSSKDREKAEQLTELLASAGLSVWIDQSALNAAASWSKEIVQAINGCKVFVVLLSPSSLESHNVIKEVSLASEKRKKILPLDLEPVTLNEDLEYQLAGIQRAPMTNIDAIIRALGKLGLEATKAPELKLVKEESGRKSLMILPFDDLSPTADNEWFANGIVSELIAALSNVKALKLADSQATKEFKSYHGQLATYAREMNIRYFVQGDVRKFGDQIKIGTRLLDIDTGDYLWQDQIKATMTDIFDVQETVANNVVEGLKLHLSHDEKQKLVERGTENAEAYEYYIKADEYFGHQTKETLLLALPLFQEAIRLDPRYVKAYLEKANTLALLYRSYDPNPVLLSEAETLCKEVIRLKPDVTLSYYSLTAVYLYQGNLEDAEQAAKEFVRKAPENSLSHFILGFFYAEIGKNSKAIGPFEESLRLKPDSRAAILNLVQSCASAHEPEKCRKWALYGLPIEERFLRLHPDDETSRCAYARFLLECGRTDDALQQVILLKNAKDSVILYRTALLFAQLGNISESLKTFRKTIETGFRSVLHLKEYFNENDALYALTGTPEYEEVKRMVEDIERETAAKKNV
jgi:TolB-like protein/cytochrome c-type biogenesis protein CcmH/NrfG